MSCYFHSEDTGSGFLWNIGIFVSNWTASYLRHNNSFHCIRTSVPIWNNQISVLPQWYLIWIAAWMYTVPFYRKCHLSFKSSLNSVVLCKKNVSEHMDIGVVKVAEDQDFEKLKKLIDDHTGWKLDYNKSSTKVWTKSVQATSFKMIKVLE